jgi:hypothetical protein
MELFNIIGQKLYNPEFKDKEEKGEEDPNSFDDFEIISNQDATPTYKLDRNTAFAERNIDSNCCFKK